MLVAFCSLAGASPAADLGLGFHTQKLSGHTTFHITATQFDEEIGADVKLDSELEFPLDVFLLGGSVRLKGSFRSGEPWSVSLGASRNLNHPSGSMKDSDWIAVPQYNYSAKFSYTESDAELEALVVYVEGRIGFLQRPNFTLELLAGYEYQDFSFEVLGVRGWQGSDLSGRVYFDTLHDVNVVDYDVTYHIPYGGMASRLRVSPRLNLQATAAIAPAVKVTDHDDHLLRFKTADSDCSGWALKVGGSLRWKILQTSAKSNWSLGLGLEYTEISTKGTQDQTWYGDDPASPDFDDTGSRATGIRQKITSSQIMIQAQIGYEF